MWSYSKSGIVPQLVNQYNDIIEQNLCQTIQLNELRNNSIDSESNDGCVESESVIKDEKCDNFSTLTNKESNRYNVSQMPHNSIAVEEDIPKSIQSDSKLNTETLAKGSDAVIPEPNNIQIEKAVKESEPNECDLNKSKETKPIEPKESYKLNAIKVNPVLEKLMSRRRHTFVMKTIVPKEICGVCGDCIQFSEKYKQCVDCIAISHMNCSAKLPVPCIRYTNPTLKPSKLISNYVYPSFKPSIPALIIHCIREVEERCHECSPNSLYVMNSEGLKQVKDLCNDIIKSKCGFPLLNKFNINIICGVIKKFLSDFNESLIGREMWKQFSYNMKRKNDDELESMVKQLIQEMNATNRDTLCFLILHLRHLKDNQKYICLEDLIQIFCPIVCGDTEVNRKIKLMSVLLHIKREFWISIFTK